MNKAGVSVRIVLIRVSCFFPFLKAHLWCISRAIWTAMYKSTCSFYTRLTFLLNIVDLVSEIEDIVRRVEVILIQQPGLTANLKDIQHQIRVLQVRYYLVCVVTD